MSSFFKFPWMEVKVQRQVRKRHIWSRIPILHLTSYHWTATASSDSLINSCSKQAEKQNVGHSTNLKRARASRVLFLY